GTVYQRIDGKSVMPKIKSTQGVLALDLGTSSVRAVVYDTRGVMLAPTLCDFPYKVRTTNPGEVSSNPDDLVRLIAASIDAALKAAHKEKVDIVACWASIRSVSRSRPAPGCSIATVVSGTRRRSRSQAATPPTSRRWRIATSGSAPCGRPSPNAGRGCTVSRGFSPLATARWR